MNITVFLICLHCILLFNGLYQNVKTGSNLIVKQLNGKVLVVIGLH